ncbi:MAG: response regulator [Labilithrix sp.]
MPRLDGLATLQRIREHSKVPVVLMSGDAPEGVPPELLALADGFVTKPFTAATLRQAFSSALKSRRKSKEERAGKRKPP